MLCCPLDQLPLTLTDRHARCANGHHFDRSREGYWPLLPAHFKRSRDPGDSRDMVRARGRFLDQGHYRALVDAVRTLLADAELPIGQYVLDAGCGEGYYLHQLQQQLGWPAHQCVGMDISKWAVRDAAKRASAITWVVGTNRQPPVAPASARLLLCLFGFQCYPAFHDVLAPGGELLLADPGPDHLLELRQLLYAEVQHKPLPTAARAEAAGLEAVAQQRVRHRISLDAAALADLALMTPHFFRANAERRAALAKLESLSVQLDVVLQRLRRPAI